MGSIDVEIDKRYASMLLTKAIAQGDCLICHKPAKNGYPKVGPNEYAHRFIFRVIKGDPEGLFVCHSCDNNRCINPDHLFLGTPQDNVDDMISKGRTGKVGGGKPRLFTAEDEDNIVELYNSGLSQRAIAREYNTSQANICTAIKRHGERNV